MADSKINGNEHADRGRGIATCMHRRHVGTHKSWKDETEMKSKGNEGK